MKYSNIKIQIKQAFMLSNFVHIIATDGAEYNVPSVVIDGVSRNVKSILRENLLKSGNIVELSVEHCVAGATATTANGTIKTDSNGLPVVYQKDHLRVNNFEIINSEYRIDDLDVLIADRMADKLIAQRNSAKVARKLDLGVQETVVPSSISDALSDAEELAHSEIADKPLKK